MNVLTNKSTALQLPPLNFEAAAIRLKKVVTQTPLQLNEALSKKYQCQIYLKREDLQVVRSYKLRGAYNMIAALPKEQLAKGVVCASAGNHAQGVAFSCKQLGVKAVIFMPTITPKQKINQTKMFGEHFVEIKLVGDTFDDCADAAKQFTQDHQMVFIPPFDDHAIIEGQATVAKEIANAIEPPDFVLIPIGGGGLCAGVGSYFKTFFPATQIIGVEPEGAPSMFEALKQGKPIALNAIDRFVDGAAVKRVGDKTFTICAQVINKMILVPEGKVCTTILQLYNENAIVVEPAGALTIAALDYLKEYIVGKKVVCIIGGGNNDIDRMPEIKERSLQYEGLKHYFLIRFAQRPGALKDFVNNVLSDNDNITRFEYMQKTNKESGPALVGIELSQVTDYQTLITRMQNHKIDYSEINKNDLLFSYLI
ncbi:MAG: threonine ammonia-lyase IlvA [Chitinophagaceae bacterium]